MALIGISNTHFLTEILPGRFVDSLLKGFIAALIPRLRIEADLNHAWDMRFGRFQYKRNLLLVVRFPDEVVVQVNGGIIGANHSSIAADKV